MINHEDVEHRRAIRRLALQMLYQLDIRNGHDADEVRNSLMRAGDDPHQRFDGPWRVETLPTSRDHQGAFDKAIAAWNDRGPADRLATELAPEWPSRRQPVVDRNIIRLCWSEMIRGEVPPKAAVNEAVELAKMFGTERSGPFLNGVLDKMMRRLAAARQAVAAGTAATQEAALAAGVGSGDEAAGTAAAAVGTSTATAEPPASGASSPVSSPSPGSTGTVDADGNQLAEDNGSIEGQHSKGQLAAGRGRRAAGSSNGGTDPAPWALDNDDDGPVEFWSSD
ncbi:MAG: transcription antitermination protein NusB [Planctomycetota bacterium]